MYTGRKPEQVYFVMKMKKNRMERNLKKVTELSLIRYFPVDTVLHAEVEMNMYVIHWD